MCSSTVWSLQSGDLFLHRISFCSVWSEITSKKTKINKMSSNEIQFFLDLTNLFCESEGQRSDDARDLWAEKKIFRPCSVLSLFWMWIFSGHYSFGAERSLDVKLDLEFRVHLKSIPVCDSQTLSVEQSVTDHHRCGFSCSRLSSHLLRWENKNPSNWGWLPVRG